MDGTGALFDSLEILNGKEKKKEKPQKGEINATNLQVEAKS